MLSPRNILLAGSSLIGISLSFSQPNVVFASDRQISSATSSVNWSSGNLTLTNSGIVSGSSVGVAVGSSASVGTLSNSGSISGASAGVYNQGNIAAISNTGKISGSSSNGVHNSGNLGTLTNEGTISGSASGDGVLNDGSLGTVINDGVISAGSNGFGIYNDTTGVLESISNLKTITGGRAGIFNQGSLSAIDNSGTISATGGNGIGLYNAGAIQTLTNEKGATIIAPLAGLDNVSSGSIGTLTNAGTLSVVSTVLTAGTVTVGTVTTGVALNNGGTISSIQNTAAGTIQSSVASGIAVSNSGSIGTLSNSGTISGKSYAIHNDGSIGLIVDSGVIAGNIGNDSSNALTIAGASGSGFGTLTGYNSGSAGTITSTLSNLVFSSGNILLNDSVNVGSYSVVNQGATLELTANSTITGNYTQTGGGLLVVTSASGSSYNYLVVNGNASVSGSTITISGSGLTKGETFVVVDPTGTGSYSNDKVTVVGTNGLSGSVSSVGGELIVTLSPTNYAASASSAGGNASAMGTFLTNALNSSNATVVASQSAEVNFLSSLSQGQQATAIKQLAPIQITPGVLATAAVNTSTAAVEAHQLAMGGGDGGGMAAGSSGHDYALWGQFLGGMSTRSTSATTDGFRTRNFGLMTGVDYTGDADVTVGGALSWLRGWFWGAGDSTGNFVQSDSYQVTGYGQRRWGAAFVDAQLGLGYTTASQRRVFNLGTDANRANYDSRLYVARLGGGYDFPVEGATLTPMIGWRFLRVVSGGYQETGTTELWKVAKADSHSWTQDLGGKVAWTVDTAWGPVTPELRIAWVHDYSQAPMTTYAFQDGTATVATATARTAADGARFNAAATVERIGDVSLRLEYEGEFRSNYQSHSGLVKATLGF